MAIEINLNADCSQLQEKFSGLPRFTQEEKESFEREVARIIPPMFCRPVSPGILCKLKDGSMVILIREKEEVGQ